MINIIIGLLIGILIGYILASIILANKKFLVRLDEKKNEIFIEPIKKVVNKMEFLPEIDQKELEEIERPLPLQSFLSRFKKSAKEKEEEEDEI